jgi:hypothetical protein
VDLAWTPYKGFPVKNYEILRGSDQYDLAYYALSNPNILSKTDLNPPEGNIYYQVGALPDAPCIPTAGKKKSVSVIYSNSMSNIEDRVPVNEPPTDILLNNNTISEKLPGFTFIGTFTAVDPNVADDHVFSLVEGVGGTDNDHFVISGDSLLSKVEFAFGEQSSYSIRVKTMDNGSDPQSFEKVFTIIILGYSETFSTSLVIYPNPFNHSAILTFPNPEKHSYTLQISDLSGKICRIIRDITTSEVVVEKGILKAGIYFIELRGPEVYRGKIIIE